MFIRRLLFLFILLLSGAEAWSQCNALRPQIDISFNTDQDCAPVSVTQFSVTYYFNVPQDPASIAILYEWNDPTGATTTVGPGTGLVTGSSASGANTTFTANATFVYTDNDNECNITPTAYVVINGAVCFTSQQVQTAFYWDTDDGGNGEVTMAPREWDVCFNNPVVNARFRDASEFNCNIVVEPDNPNRAARHVQFVYGTNHNPANSIRNLTLNDGGVRPLTDGTGALASTQTHGSGGVTITGAWFGPVEAIPFPADGPTSVSFPMNAPADAANAVGSRFEVTLFNWNICNPWNGDPVDPNYEDAIITTGYIVIVEAPAPDFYTEDTDGNVVSDFCIDEVIRFRNATPNVNAYNYTWRFYDDALGTNLIHTSTQRHPQYAFSSGGTKLIRLTATNPTAQGACEEELAATVNITPSMLAEIGVTDLNDVPIDPRFCQEPATPLNDFDVRFHDQSTGTATPTTVRRWEFYDEQGSLVFESPAAGGFSGGVAGPFDRVFTDPGVYRVVLRIQDNVTGCESSDEKQVYVSQKPSPAFTATTVCETFATTFEDQSVLVPVSGETIVLRQWDLSYDGVAFDADPALDNQQIFSHIFPSAGTYRVALRVVTSEGCEMTTEHDVTVNVLPQAAFTPDRTSGCSALQVQFTNHSVNGQPDGILEYRWEIDAGSGFEADRIQRPTDPDFGSVFTRTFVNAGDTDVVFLVRLRVVTVNGCEQVSSPETITVYPAPRAGFVSMNYSPFESNCSPVSVTFDVDAATQSMNPTEFIWTVADADGLLAQQSTGTTPAYNFEFVNTTQAIKDYSVTLHATLPSGCSGDSTRVIRVNPVPVSGFTMDPVLVTCERVTLHINAARKGLMEYAWTVRSNGVVLLSSTAMGDAFNYEVTRAAVIDQDIEVTLVTRNFANCVSTPTTENIVVGPQEDINAAFIATPLSQKFPDATVTLTNQTQTGNWNYLWDFGDGTTSTDPDVGTHTYATWGTYTITLSVYGAYCEEHRSMTIEILPPAAILDFSYDPPSGCAPLTVNFTNHSQLADPSTYVWDFGDGEPVSHAVNPSHVYYHPGVYTVTLSATDFAGDPAEVVKQFIIEVFETPIARFNVKPSQVPFPGGKLYTDNQSFGATGFVWDFGDGTTSTLFEPEHIYETEGVFTITLTASNAEGCVDTRVLEAGARTVRTGRMLVPNAFSPNLFGPGNSDGQNDVFRPILQGVTEFQMLVFNRWGQLLFETKDPLQGWDGYYQGKLCQQDVYVYKIIATYSDGQQVVQVGDIHLMR